MRRRAGAPMSCPLAWSRYISRQCVRKRSILSPYIARLFHHLCDPASAVAVDNHLEEVSWQIDLNTGIQPKRTPVSRF